MGDTSEERRAYVIIKKNHKKKQSWKKEGKVFHILNNILLGMQH